MPPTSVNVSVPNELMAGLLGQRDELLRLVEAAFPGTTIHVRGNEIAVNGADAERAGRTFEELRVLLERGERLDAANVGRAIDMVLADERPSEVLTAEVLKSARGRSVRPKTSGQKRYTDAIAENVITFGIGPAGTGKSYLAVALAVQALQAKQVERIILTRPAVEAGERLGFLPGDLMAKIDPYLRPLYDALYDMLTPEGAQRLIENSRIEIAPLAFMRGRAQPVGTPVLTPTGFQPIGELEVGDLVVGADGRPTPVLGVYPQGRKPVFRVTAQDGASTLACGEHLWFVRTPRDRKRGKPGHVVQTADMIGRLRRRRSYRFELPVVAPVAFEPREAPDDPYAVGRMLAGDVSGAAIHLHGGSLRQEPVDGVLLATEPAISAYTHNAASVREAVLQGVLDLIGAPCDDGAIRVRLRSAEARDTVVFLVQSLGGTAAATSGGMDIRLPAGVVPFRLERKRAIYDAARGDRPMRYVDSIEPAGDAECVCIAVGAADSLYVTSDFIVTHNTLNSSFIILDEAQNTTPEQMKMFLTRIGFGSKAVVTGDVTQVDLDGNKSGLINLEQILGDIDGLAFVRLTAKDVVRHRIVQEIVTAYERAQAMGMKP